MVRPVVLRSAAAAVAVLVALSACSSAGGHDQRSVTVSETRDHDGLEVAVSKQLARDLLQGVVGSALSCDADLDPDFEGLLRDLERRGRGAGGGPERISWSLNCTFPQGSEMDIGGCYSR